MKRVLGLSALCVLAVGLRVGAQDTVYFLDPTTKKEVNIDIKIERESPAGIEYKKSEKVTVVIPALDITQVTYKVTGLSAAEFRRGDFLLNRASAPDNDADKRKTGLENARREFERIAEKVVGLTGPHRYVQYRLAQIVAYEAQSDPAKLDAAAEALNKYQKSFPSSWEVVPCLKMLAELEEGRNKIDGALVAYEAMSTLPEVPPSIQKEASFLVAQLLMRNNRPTDAESKLVSLESKLDAKDPQLPLVKVMLTQSQMAQNKLGSVLPQLRAALKATEDNDIRAVAHNVFGDYYQKKNQPEEAFWQYLRVDVMYSQNPEQHAKALYNLWKLFASAKADAKRAKECYDRLMGEDFATTEFHAKAKAEGMKE